MARYRTQRAPARPPLIAVVLNYLTYVVLIAVCLATLYLAWPMIHARITGAPIVQDAPSAPLVAPAPAARPFTPAVPQDAARAVPTASLAQTEATSLAVYHATVQAVNAAPIPNVDTTNDSAPVVREQKAVDPRPAGVVPTSEPLGEVAPGDDSHGSKAAPPLDIQATHQCLHAAVWVDGVGCQNPTPTGGG